MIGAAAISLFATICIDGTLHGLPKVLCNEFEVGTYRDAAACNQAWKDHAVDRWLAARAWLQPHFLVARCGPAEAGGEGDDI